MAKGIIRPLDFLPVGNPDVDENAVVHAIFVHINRLLDQHDQDDPTVFHKAIWSLLKPSSVVPGISQKSITNCSLIIAGSICGQNARICT